MHPNEFFRAGVGVMIVDSKGRVLAFERKEYKNSWQSPQGGIERHE